MTHDFAATTDDIRHGFVESYPRELEWRAEETFTEWLIRHEREAAAQGWAEGRAAMLNAVAGLTVGQQYEMPVNPYDPTRGSSSTEES